MVIISMMVNDMDHILFITIIGIMCHCVHSMILYPMSATFTHRVRTHQLKAGNVLSLHSPFIMFLSTLPFIHRVDWFYRLLVPTGKQWSGFARFSWWVLFKLVNIVYHKCLHFHSGKIQKSHRALEIAAEHLLVQTRQMERKSLIDMQGSFDKELEKNWVQLRAPHLFLKVLTEPMLT